VSLLGLSRVQHRREESSIFALLWSASTDLNMEIFKYNIHKPNTIEASSPPQILFVNAEIYNESMLDTNYFEIALLKITFSQEIVPFLYSSRKGVKLLSTNITYKRSTRSTKSDENSPIRKCSLRGQVTL
jgi:hypothetical protein